MIECFDLKLPSKWTKQWTNRSLSTWSVDQASKIRVKNIETACDSSWSRFFFFFSAFGQNVSVSRVANVTYQSNMNWINWCVKWWTAFHWLIPHYSQSRILFQWNHVNYTKPRPPNYIKLYVPQQFDKAIAFSNQAIADLFADIFCFSSSFCKTKAVLTAMPFVNISTSIKIGRYTLLSCCFPNDFHTEIHQPTSTIWVN